MESIISKFDWLTAPDFWKELLSNDFNRGYLAALALVLGLMLVLMVLRFLVFLIFRTRRCRSVEIQTPGGMLIISRTALENAARQILKQYSALEISSIRLYRRGRRYSLRIYCALNGKDGVGLPKLSDEIRPALNHSFLQSFGLPEMREIRFVLEDFTPAENVEVSIPTASVAAAVSGESNLRDEHEADTGL